MSEKPEAEPQKEPTGDPTPDPSPQQSAPDPAPSPDPTPEPQDPPKEVNWYDDISDDKSREFASRFASKSDLAKTALNFRQKLSNAVTLPGENASEEDIADFRTKMGVPGEAQGYKLHISENIPDYLRPEEGDKGFEKFKEAMHKTNARPDVAQAAVDWFFETATGVHEQQVQALTKYRADNTELLKKEWGNDYDKNMALAKSFITQFGDSDLNDSIKNLNPDAPEGSIEHLDPPVLRMFANAGRRIGEDALHIGPSDQEKQTINEQVSDIRDKKREAQKKGDNARVEALDRQERDLLRKIYPDTPTVGTQGKWM